AALLLFVFVALVGQPFARADVTVYDIEPASVAAEAGLQPGDIITAVNGQEVESADAFNRLITDNLNQAVTLRVKRDAATFETTLNVTDQIGRVVERVYIDSVERNMPAYDAGFLPEDLIVAVDGIEISSIKQLQDYTQAHNHEEIVITVLRGSERLDLPVTPRPDSSGVVRIGIGIAGVEPSAIGVTAVNRNAHTYTRALPLGEAINTGVDQFIDLHRLMAEFVQDLIRGDVALETARPVSPVGIGQLGAPIFEQSLDEGEMYPIVLFAAMISVALGLTNLLPIPGLDGGRILFVVIEIIRGKPMKPEREGLIHLIGVMLLLGLIFFTVLNDIFNPINIDSIR
nr:RIP metalloprotease RseP [Anaerolineae bacterium]